MPSASQARHGPSCLGRQPPTPRPPGTSASANARVSTVRQPRDTQLDALTAAGVTRVFREKISTRTAIRPELDKAVALAQEMRASGVSVTLADHEHKRLGPRHRARRAAQSSRHRPGIFDE
ncbi:recombinase family protein [Nocardia sputorum]|uniref:recombinase family protein n=1 Tax=Nocardia sputorum TaxID=2984338 RepID=UPI00331392C0